MTPPILYYSGIVKNVKSYDNKWWEEILGEFYDGIGGKRGV